MICLFYIAFCKNVGFFTLFTHAEQSLPSGAIINASDIDNILIKLAVKWRKLGEKLHISTTKLDEFDGHDNEKCLMSVYEEWLRSSKSTTYEVLIQALSDVKRPVAASLCRKLGKLQKIWLKVLS